MSSIKKSAITMAALLACTSALASWRYVDNVDQMTSKATSHAVLESSNSLNLDSPYTGKNNGTLTVRKHPRYGTSVIFSIEQGQLMCRSSQCDVKVRFDDGQPITFSGTEPADSSSTMIFINNSSKFIAAASKAKRILVQTSVYQNGAPVLEFFAPEPLVWKPKK